MKNCPTCGIALDSRLVDAIQNPSMPESCPRDDSAPAEPSAKLDAVGRLAALMMIGAGARD